MLTLITWIVGKTIMSRYRKTRTSVTEMQSHTMADILSVSGALLKLMWS